jgi:hypothetical protein
VLETELSALPAGVRLIAVDADPALGELPISSKFNTDAHFLMELFEEGRIAAERALAAAPAVTDGIV